MRHLFRLISAVILTLVGLSACQSDTKAKYIFLFIGDGMGASHVAVTESYLSYKEGKLGGEQLDKCKARWWCRTCICDWSWC